MFKNILACPASPNSRLGLERERESVHPAENVNVNPIIASSVLPLTFRLAQAFTLIVIRLFRFSLAVECSVTGLEGQQSIGSVIPAGKDGGV